MIWVSATCVQQWLGGHERATTEILWICDQLMWSFNVNWPAVLAAGILHKRCHLVMFNFYRNSAQ